MVRRTYSCAVILILASVPVIAHAEPRFRVSSEFTQRMESVRTVVIVTPDIKAYELMRNDQPVFQAAWTDTSKANVAAAIQRALVKRGLTARLLGDGADAALEDAAPMYRAVLAAIFEATYINKFQAQKERFEYTLGNLGPLIGEDADAAVFVWGLGAASSGGRKAFQLLLGSGSFALDRLVIAVVARDGEVLWFDAIVSGAYDLREAESCGRFVDSAMNELPEVKK